MTPEQAAALRAPFPAEAIGKLPRGGIMIDYVGHAATTDRLLQVDPEWTWEPLGLTTDGLPALDSAGNLWIRLTIAGVTRLGVGDGKTAKECVGDAIRNAAMRFGVALDLWSKEDLHAAQDAQKALDALTEEAVRSAVKAGAIDEKRMRESVATHRASRNTADHEAWLRKAIAAASSAGRPERPDAAATTATATAQPSDGGQPSPLPADESPVGEGLHTPASGDGPRHSSPAPTGTTFAAPVDTLKPAAQFAAGTSEKKTLNLLNTLIVKGRKAGLFTTHDVYSWAREIDPLNVRDDAWYIEADGILHWADLRSEAPVWLCSQLLDRLKLEFPAWFMENAKGRAA